MNSVAPRPLLARLRTSARLAVLVLLVFAIKIGAATACAKHDFADMGLGSDSDHAAFVKVALADDGAAANAAATMRPHSHRMRRPPSCCRPSGWTTASQARHPAQPNAWN